jgi:hypothetical protein
MDTSKNQLIIGNDDLSQLWYTPKNPNLTIKARSARTLISYLIFRYLNIPITVKPVAIRAMIERINNDREKWETFIATLLDKAAHKECQTIADIENYKQLADALVQKHFPTSKIILDVESQSYQGDPTLIVRHNGKVLFDQPLPDGEHHFEFDVDNDFLVDNSLEISMSGKGQFDTMVDDAGNILKDKKIIIKTFKIDRINLLDTSWFMFLQEHTSMADEKNQPMQSQGGFWKNATLGVKYQAPFWRFYLSKAPKPAHWAYSDYDDLDKALDEYKTCMLKFEY